MRGAVSVCVDRDFQKPGAATGGFSAASVSAEMGTYLNWLLQDPAADGAYKVFINIPLEPCYIIPHCSSPTPETCGGENTAG